MQGNIQDYVQQNDCAQFYCRGFWSNFAGQLVGKVQQNVKHKEQNEFVQNQTDREYSDKNEKGGKQFLRALCDKKRKNKLKDKINDENSEKCCQEGRVVFCKFA